MEQDLPRKLDRETLVQLPSEQLVEMITEQAIQAIVNSSMPAPSLIPQI